MNLLLDSASVYDALLQQLGPWALQDHAFDTDVDEVHVSYDIGGSGRVALTVGFELTEPEMAKLLSIARPADA